MLKSAGFTCMRLPIAPQDLLLNFLGTNAKLQGNLARLDSTIDMFLNAGMAVMLDFHADPEYVTYYFNYGGTNSPLWRRQ